MAEGFHTVVFNRVLGVTEWENAKGTQQAGVRVSFKALNEPKGVNRFTSFLFTASKEAMVMAIAALKAATLQEFELSLGTDTSTAAEDAAELGRKLAVLFGDNQLVVHTQVESWIAEDGEPRSHAVITGFAQKRAPEVTETEVVPAPVVKGAKK